MSTAKLPKSARARAWRNMVVAAINAGIDQGVFTLRPGPVNERVYSFNLGGLPGIAKAWSAATLATDFDEVRVNVAMRPTPKGERVIGAINAGFDAGDAFANGYLARAFAPEGGAWIETGYYAAAFGSRSHLKPKLAASHVKPNGFSDTGRLFQ